MRLPFKKKEPELLMSFDFVSVATPEQMAAMSRAFPDLIRQLEARKEIAQREFEADQFRHTQAWLQSFGVEVSKASHGAGVLTGCQEETLIASAWNPGVPRD